MQFHPEKPLIAFIKNGELVLHNYRTGSRMKRVSEGGICFCENYLKEAFAMFGRIGIRGYFLDNPKKRALWDTGIHLWEGEKVIQMFIGEETYFRTNRRLIKSFKGKPISYIKMCKEVSFSNDHSLAMWKDNQYLVLLNTSNFQAIKIDIGKSANAIFEACYRSAIIVQKDNKLYRINIDFNKLYKLYKSHHSNIDLNTLEILDELDCPDGIVMAHKNTKDLLYYSNGFIGCVGRNRFPLPNCSEIYWCPREKSVIITIVEDNIKVYNIGNDPRRSKNDLKQTS